MEAEVDLQELERFEASLDPLHTERSEMPVRVLGFGEMSTVLEIAAAGLEGLAFKRMPIFESVEQAAAYEQLCRDYARILNDDVGIRVPAQTYAILQRPRGRTVFYVIQEKLPQEAICNSVIHRLDRAGLRKLFLSILRELDRVASFNASGGPAIVGIDGQVSNWAVLNRSGIGGGKRAELLYFDTGTPLIRKSGKEMIDTELFLRTTPPGLRWLIRKFFLQEVLDRYYDFRLIALDIMANFYKEGMADAIAELVQEANAFFDGRTGKRTIGPITKREITFYYMNDSTMWRIFLSARKLDRFIKAKILGREYDVMLPERIKRW